MASRVSKADRPSSTVKNFRALEEKIAQAMHAEHRIFLSPANAAGVRAKMVASDRAQFELAVRFRSSGVPLGELFSFISGLYFRGKLAYSKAFAQGPPGLGGTYVITASGGLIEPNLPITRDRLHEISAGQVEASNARYRGPLERDARN